MASDSLNQKFIYIPSYALILSLLVHGGISFFLMNSSMLENLGISLTKREDIKSVYDSFIQVDVVALPDQMFNENKSIDTALPYVEKPSVEEQIKETHKEDVMPLPNTKAQLAEKLKHEQELANQKKKEEDKKRKVEQDKAMKKIEEEVRREQALKSLGENAGKKSGRQKLAGNRLSQGTAATGAIGAAKDRWTSLVAQAIKNQFNIFPWQRKRNLSAVIQMQLYPTGRLRERKIIKRSADPTYDSAVLQAADAAQPFPLPDDLGLLDEPIIIELKPEG